MANVQIIDNSAKVLSAVEQAKARALEIIGGKVESYAKQLCPVDTGTLRNSITHNVNGDVVQVGSAVNYAPYVELGTGKEYDPAPGWLQSNAPQGAGLRQGVKPRPYLRPAVENHVEEYKHVLQNELKNA